VLLEFGLVLSLAKLFAWLPGSVAYALGEGAGRLAYRLDRRHREITQDNLARAFPGVYRPEQIEAISRGVFENLGRTAVDVARSGRLLETENLTAMGFEGGDRIEAAKRRGKGVLAITAHLGPWELLPLGWVLHVEPSYLVARPLDNPRLDDFFTRLRERGGNRVIRKQQAVQSILQALRRGGIVGILIDQHTSEREGVVVPFFGRPACTVAAPALIAMRSGAPVLPVAVFREARGRYVVRVGEEVPVRRSGDVQTDLAVNTARFTEAIEAFVRARPDQWFWVHRRWKTRLPLDPRLQGTDASGCSLPVAGREETRDKRATDQCPENAGSVDA